MTVSCHDAATMATRSPSPLTPIVGLPPPLT